MKKKTRINIISFPFLIIIFLIIIFIVYAITVTDTLSSNISDNCNPTVKLYGALISTNARINITNMTLVFTSSAPNEVFLYEEYDNQLYNQTVSSAQLNLNPFWTLEKDKKYYILFSYSGGNWICRYNNWGSTHNPENDTHICWINRVSTSTYLPISILINDSSRYMTDTVQAITSYNITEDIGNGGITPSLTLYTNMTNSTITNFSNFFVSFNGTSVNNTDIYNCNLLLDGTINRTENNLDLSYNNLFNFTFGNMERWINISINCSNENATDIKNAWYFIDNINPKIKTNFINNSGYYDNTNLKYHFNFSDTNLYAFNHSIFDSSGNIKRNDFLEDFNSSFYQLNITNSTSKLGIDTYIIQVYVWDSHTNNKLKNKPKVKDNILTFNNIKFYCDNINKMDYILESDKIKPKIKFNKKGKQKCYYEGNFKKVSKTKYNNHYVDLINNIWIDEEKGISKTEKNKIVIEFTSNIDFISDSIGELNLNHKTYYFNISSAPSFNTELLQDINTSLILMQNLLNTTKKETVNISGGVDMIAYFGLLIFLIILSFKYNIAIVFSGINMIWISLLYGQRMIEEETTKYLFYKFGVFGFGILGLIIILIGITLMLFNYLEIEPEKKFKFLKKKKEKKSFYPKY